MKKLLIFDGNSIINRAFYGIRLLTNAKGQATNAVYGFLNIFLKFMEEEAPDYVAVAFDLKAPTFRHKQFEAYKANRKGMPEELAEQLPYLKQILDDMNVKRLELEGYEADDIIGTVSKQCEDNGVACSIVTGDKDDLQLASDKTVIRLVVTKMGNTETTDYDAEKVQEVYGVTPREFIDVKALMGDPSDNIPGVAGIGEKSAFSLIQKYKSLDGVYCHLDELKGSQKAKIEQGRDQAYMSFTLAQIVRDVPLETGMEEMRVRDADAAKLYADLNELELKSLIARLNLAPGQEDRGQVLQLKREEITSPAQLKELLCQETLYYDFYIGDNQLKELSCLKDDVVYYLSFFTEFDFMAYETAIKEAFEDEGVFKVSHNIKKDIVLLKENYNIDYKGAIFDIKIAGYLEQPSRPDYQPEEMAQEYLQISQVPEGCAVGLYPALQKALEAQIGENEQEELFYKVELPLVKVLASMEIEGFKVDKEKLAEFSVMLARQIDSLQGDIYTMAGEEFNINSPKQLGVILFEKLGLPAVKKTKTGYSTNVDVLEKLRDKHEIIGKIMEYRTYTKLKSTYADGLYNVINSQTGKIHSSFNQTITATGRISSTEPNLQNIPVRLELGREIRRMFIASDDQHLLVDADYSQIELRVLAHIAGDENMIQAFQEGVDIHTMTASQVFGVPMDQVTSQMRSRAKAVNFGIVYGIGEFSLAQDIGVTRKEAGQYIASYFERYPQIKKYLDETVAFAKENGYVVTAAGRRRYIPEIKSSNFNLRAFGERVAMNAPIQGYAADIIKIAMVRVYERLAREGLHSKLILQVHDELIIDGFTAELDQVKKILKEEMEQAVKMDVPLKVDMKTGKSWYDTK